VHYLRFPLSPEATARLRDPAIAAQIAIDHDHYRVAAVLPHALRASLVADLDADPAPLLVPAPGAAVTQTRVRVRKPDQPLGRGHVVIEAVAEQASWFDADPTLEAEVLAELKRCAREVAAAHGNCRVFCDVLAPGLRWNVLAE